MEEPDFPYPIQKYSGKAKWVMLIGAVLFVTITVIVVWGIFTRQKQNETKGLEIKKVLAVEYKQLSNSPTSKPKKEKANVTIQVLNGTGISGQAGLVVKTLEMSGYNLANIKIANAETIDHSVTIITSRADLEEIVINIKDALKPMFPEITDGIPNTNPNDDSGFDVVIVTGGKKTSNITLNSTSSPTKSP